MKTIQLNIRRLSGIAASMFLMLLQVSPLCAQDEAKSADLQLQFQVVDSVKTCTASVQTDSAPVKEVEVHFYVKRMYSLLPIGDAVATDENGKASVEFPNDLPGDAQGMLEVIARIEEDENYGDIQAEAQIGWGTKLVADQEEWNHRSLSASRDKAPMYLILASNLIIAGIWGTILFVIYQIVRIKKSGRTVS